MLFRRLRKNISSPRSNMETSRFSVKHILFNHRRLRKLWPYMIVLVAVILLLKLYEVAVLFGIKTDLPLSADQSVIDYIGHNLQVNYIWRKGGWMIKLTNGGTEDIVAGNWTIFFSHVDLSHEVAHARHKIIEENGLMIQHHDGWLYSLQPVIDPAKNFSFRTIKPNESIIVEFKMDLKSKSYAFPRWYVAGGNTQPRVIVSTDSENGDFVINFKGLMPPLRRFDQNLVEDLGRAVNPVVPSPLKFVKDEKSREITLDSSWRIFFSDDLKNEADYLAEKLHLPVIELSANQNTPPKTISLQQRDLKDEFIKLQSSIEIHLPEFYVLHIHSNNSVTVIGQTAGGVFYGIQSLLSLMAGSPDGWSVPTATIFDGPRLEYRGLMVDVARNFFNKKLILKTMEVMAMYKMNKFHFHLTDDQGWRIDIPDLPELIEVGGKRGHGIEGYGLPAYLGYGPFSNKEGKEYYTVEDYRDILQRAKQLHIEVIPEIDMPGHGHAAIESMRVRYKRMKQAGSSEEVASQYLLSDPNDESFYLGINQQMDSVVNPCMNSTYDFVEVVLKALIKFHKDIQPLAAIHFGGDEVPSEALVKSPICLQLIKNQPELKGHLKTYFMKKVIAIAARLDLGVLAWEDGLRVDGKDTPSLSFWGAKHLGINAWLIGKPAPIAFANAGVKVILSHADHLYLDHPHEPDIEERGLYWAIRSISALDIFSYIPVRQYIDNSTSFIQSEVCKLYNLDKCINLTRPEYIIGMQAALWGEMIRTPTQADEMMFPRLLAIAERAWHMAGWEMAADREAFERLRRDDWGNFVNTVGYKELRRLDKMKVFYRIPPPGARKKSSNGDVLELYHINTEFPGLVVQYSRDNGRKWTNHTTAELTKMKNETLLLSTLSCNLERRSRIIVVE